MVHLCEQGDVPGDAGARAAQSLAANSDRPQSGTGRGGAGREEGADRPVRVSPSSWTSRRRRVWGCGTDTVPESGAAGKPRTWRAHAGTSQIHSVIAVSERAPARTLAAAAASRAYSR
ncbi:hypothetical protein GCM10010306_096690 [Streptomyces umbrinus]|nr:hypothetical protein GCM10010306_096690 [Streptomyces umbrinus]